MLLIRLDKPQWDYSACARLEEKLRPAFTEPHVIIDMSAVTFLELECLAVLLRLYKTRVGRSGFPPARIVAHSHELKSLLKRAGVGSLWPIFSSVEDALMDLKFKADGSKPQ